MARVRSVNSRHDQSSTKILNYMSDANETTFGFVFYRCCSYDNDARWSDFMIRMNAWAIWGLEGEADGIAIRDRLSLETVEDPTLVGASKEDIRMSVFLLTHMLNVPICVFALLTLLFL